MRLINTEAVKMSSCNCSAAIRKFTLFARRQTIAKPVTNNKSSSLLNKFLILNINTCTDIFIHFSEYACLIEHSKLVYIEHKV